MPCLVQLTHMDSQTRLYSNLTNLQLNPKPVVSYKPEKSVDLRCIESSLLYHMLHKALRPLARLRFLISSDKMKALCIMLGNINNVIF